MDPYLNSGLFDCFSDCDSCCYGLFCPCCLNATNLAQARKETCNYTHLFCFVHPFWTRQTIRQKENLEYDFCKDGIIAYMCPSLFICQDSRILKAIEIQRYQGQHIDL